MVYPKIMQGFYTTLEAILRSRGLIAGKSGRHMKFPYTIAAKVAQFPYFHYMKYNNIWMYYPCGMTIAFYFICKIHNLVNSEGNVANWAESQRKIAEKEAAEHH